MKLEGVLVENSGRCSTNDAGEKARSVERQRMCLRFASPWRALLRGIKVRLSYQLSLQVLPNGTAWLSNVVGKVVSLTQTAGPWVYSRKSAKVCTQAHNLHLHSLTLTTRFALRATSEAHGALADPSFLAAALASCCRCRTRTRRTAGWRSRCFSSRCSFCARCSLRR